jgi:hypothetical protein
MRLVATAAVLGLLAAPMMGISAASAQGPRGPMNQDEDVTDHVQTTRDLANVCDPRVRGVRRYEAIAYCQGYLTAAGQYHAMMFPAGGRMQPLYCVPTPGPSVAEAGLGFSAWARENPGRWNEPALDGFLRWAQERFPCEPAQPARRNRPNR